MEQLMEPSPQVDVSHTQVPETSEGSSNADVRESDNTDMVIEESPVREQTFVETAEIEETSSSPFSSPPFDTEIQTGTSHGMSDSDSFGTPAVDTVCPSSPEHKALETEVEPEDDHIMDTEEDRILDLTEEEEEETVDATEEQTESNTVAEDPSESTMAEETEKDTISVEETEDQTLAEGDQSEDAMVEKEDDDSRTMEPEASVETGAADDTAGSAVLEDSTEGAVLPGNDLEDSETLSAAVEEPAQQPTPAASRSKTAVRRRNSKAKRTKLTQKVAKARSSKVSVPTVTVTAPSDQSDDSEAGKLSATSSPYNLTLSSLPRRIENSDNLPPGWTRIMVMRMGGQHAGKYDTTLFSDTNFKMRSFPNVRDYLEKQGLQHYLEDERYDFKFRQPFSTPKGKGSKEKQQSSVDRSRTKSPAAASSVKTKNNKTPTTGSAKSSKSKSPASGSKKADKSDSSGPTKVCVTLKRKIPVWTEESEGGSGSPDLSAVWEVKKPPKAKARKKTTPASKKDSPQLKLDGFITRHKPSQAATAKESKFKSSFKTVLHKNPKKSREEVTEAAEQVATSPRVEAEQCGDTTSEKSEEVVDLVEEEVEETAHDADKAEVVSDEYAAQDTDKAEVISDEDTDKSEVISDEGADKAEVVSDEGADKVKVISDEGVDKPEVISDEDAEKGDNETVSDVYLAEEQEEPYRSEDEEEEEARPEEENAGLPAGNWSEDMEEEAEGEDDDDAKKGAISEDSSSEEEASFFELKSEESDDNSSAPTPIAQEAQEPLVPHHAANDDAKLADPLTGGTAAASNKRSLSPSDSDVSARKRARLWREADAEEDSSRSAGMCSDLSLPGGAGGQEEDENQNMTSKVQTLHLWDSSSSMKDSASTSSSNSGSLMVPTSSQLLSPPAWAKSSRAGGGGGGGGVSGGVSPPRLSVSGRKRSSRPAARADTTTSTTSSTSAADVADSGSAAEGAAAANTNGGAPSGERRRVRARRDVTWSPPRSPFNLIQERLYHDPWKMLVGTIFLQEVGAEVAIPLLWKFLNRWHCAEEVRSVDTEHIARMLHPMMRNETTAATVVRFSEEYMKKDWNYPLELHGIDKDGDDSYRIFCIREWDQVKPDDKRLSSYCLWLSQNREELGLE